MSVSTFVIIGWGWRSRQFAEIAAALPDRFRCAGVLRRKADGSEGGLPVFTDLAAAAAAGADFMLVSLPWAEMPRVIAECAERGLPVLAETPPAPDAAGLCSLWDKLGAIARIQVAEQYPARPLHRAVQQLISDGLIGRPVQADVSVGHGYHGMAVIRQHLGVRFELPTVRGFRHSAQVIGGPGRAGPPTEEKLKDSTREVIALDFGDGRLGIHDFDGEQYFSWIRTPRLRVRGTRGEIDEGRVRWLIDHATPMQAALERRDAGHGGHLVPLHLEGYTAAGRWLYRNPFAPATFSDDFIAMATVLADMAAYAAGGDSTYGLAEACHDHWLGIHGKQALDVGRELTVPKPPWIG